MIIREQKQIADASPADLVETYNALTGKAIKKFETRAVGERRVEMAMLAAINADGQTGVPKGANGKVKTAEELAVKAKDKGLPAPDLDPDAPTTVLQTNSARNSILTRIHNSPKSAATVADLEAHFDGISSLKGELRKLELFGHLVILPDEASYASVKEVAKQPPKAPVPRGGKKGGKGQDGPQAASGPQGQAKAAGAAGGQSAQSA